MKKESCVDWKYNFYVELYLKNMKEQLKFYWVIGYHIIFEFRERIQVYSALGELYGYDWHRS